MTHSFEVQCDVSGVLSLPQLDHTGLGLHYFICLSFLCVCVWKYLKSVSLALLESVVIAHSYRV